MLRRRVFVLLSVLLALAGVGLRAQRADRAIMSRMDALEAAIHGLEERVADLTELLQSIVPSPVEKVQPIDLPISAALAKGAAGAKAVIVEFADFQCQYCGQYTRTVYPQVIRQLVETGKVRYVFHHLPLESLHPNAFKAAEAAQCASEQGKFWEVHDLLFMNQEALGTANLVGYAKALSLNSPEFESCLGSGRMATKIRGDLQDAVRMGITSTPTFLVGENKGASVRVTRRISGAQEFRVFEAAVQDLVAR